MRKAIVFRVWFVLLSWGLWAGDPVVTAELDARDAYLGDPLNLTVRVSFEEGWSLADVVLPDTLGEGRVLKQDWVQPEGQPLKRELHAQVAWYRHGTFKLPPIEMIALSPEGENKALSTSELSVEIIKMLEDEDQDAAPPKGQVNMEVSPLWPWVAALVALLAILVWAFFRWRSKREVSKPVPVVPLKPPYEEALLALEALTHSSLLKEGNFKQFYVELNEVIRHYYARLFHIHAEEMTSFELEDWMADQCHLPEMAVPLNREFQDLCDRVKYAKYDPSDAEHKEIVSRSHQILELLKPKEADHVPAS